MDESPRRPVEKTQLGLEARRGFIVWRQVAGLLVCRCPRIHAAVHAKHTQSVFGRVAAAGHVKILQLSLDCCHLTAGMSTNKSSCKNGILNRF